MFETTKKAGGAAVSVVRTRWPYKSRSCARWSSAARLTATLFSDLRSELGPRSYLLRYFQPWKTVHAKYMKYDNSNVEFIVLINILTICLSPFNSLLACIVYPWKLYRTFVPCTALSFKRNNTAPIDDIAYFEIQILKTSSEWLALCFVSCHSRVSFRRYISILAICRMLEN